MKKTLIAFTLGTICTLIGGVFAATSNDTLATSIANTIWGVIEKIEIMKVGGTSNYDKMQKLYESKFFVAQQTDSLKQVMSQMNITRDEKAKVQASYPITATKNKSLETLIAEKIGAKVDVYEAKKIGGLLNYANIQKIYTSKVFKDQQKQSIESVLKNMTSSVDTNDMQTLTKSQITAIKKDAFIQGVADATILIVEYTDPECPFCIRHIKDKTIATALSLSSYSSIAHIAKVVEGVNHPGTRLKSLAAICIGKQKGSDSYYSFLNDIMSTEKTSTSKQLYDIAQRYGIDNTSLDTCIADKTTQAQYDANRTEAQQYGQTGTPGHLIINTKTGKYRTLAGAYPEKDFRDAIVALIK